MNDRHDSATVPRERLRALADLIALHATEDEVDTWVRRATGEPLRNFLGIGGRLRQPTPARAFLRMMTELDAEGRTSLDRFLREVYRERELQRQVVAELDAIDAGLRATLNRPELDLSPDRGGGSAPIRRLLGDHAGGLMRGDWIDRFEAAYRRVCRIERAGKSFGSGFAVGPQAIVTAGHVADAAGIAPGLDARFGFRLRAGGALEPGEIVPIDGAAVVNLPPSAAERQANPDPRPAEGEIDFALFRLAHSPDPGRKWFALPSSPPRIDRNAPLIVIQYPGQSDLSHSLLDQAVTEAKAQGGLRIRYRNRTAPGSSGSPCLSMDMALVAMHHFGDQEKHPQAFRQGIPAHLIRAAILAAGAGAHLGGQDA